MQKMALKRGASHLGFVLAFVIFVMFLFFMYSAVEPMLRAQSNKQVLLENMKLNFVKELKNSGGEVITMRISLSGSRNHDCVKLTGGNLYDNASSGTLLKIKSDAGNLISYRFQGQDSQLLIGVPQTYTGMLNVYYGSNIDRSSNYTGSAGCDQVTSTTDSIKTEAGIFDSTITSLKSSYESGYDSLKSTLGIPSENDFTFTFDFMNGTVITPKSVIVPNTNVYAETFPVEYLDADANLKIGLLTLKIW